MATIDNTIKDLVEDLVAPTRKTGLPDASSSELEDTAWFDFTEVKYLFDPAEVLPTPSLPESGLSVYELDTAIYLEDAGVGSSDYEEFQRRLRGALTRAVVDALCNRPIVSVGSNFSRFAPDYDEETETLTFVPDNDPATYPTGPILQPITYDIRHIVDMLVFAPSFELVADIADIYFSIEFADAATTYYAKGAFFNYIYQQFVNRNGNLGDVQNMVRTYTRLSTGDLSFAIGEVTVGEIVQGYWNELYASLVEIYGEGQENIDKILADYEYQAPPASDYTFNPFLHKEVNLGLRLVYRQIWRPLGNQRGEIVRTIPLGPKQSHKVSTKILRRTKVTRTSEHLKSTERSEETTDTTKDSREVVREATSSYNWNISQEIEGGYNAGVWGIKAKTAASVGGESARSSRNASTRLSESMRKMASKISTETRVNVSTETETEFETSTASEILNPNDEIPITYLYSKLQRQYEVFTGLAELQNVIMIAERVPPPEKINLEWVKKHDWILAKVLLDDSFRDALNSVSQEIKSPDTADFVAHMKKTMDSTVGHLGTLSGTATNLALQNVDVASEAQTGYRRSIKERIEWQRQNYELKAKQNRLFEHIRANILHYHRAIWLQEDPQQRMMRYRKLGIALPVNWEFHPNEGQPISIDSLVNIIGSEGAIDLDGTYEPAPDSITIPIVDLINPAGPISFYANYAVYYMRPEYMQGNIFSMLNFYKAPYLFYEEESSQPQMIDPVLKQYRLDYPPAYVADKDIRNNRDEMIDLVPALRIRLRNARREKDELPSGDDSDPVNDFLNDILLFKKYFAEFLYRKEMTRRVLVDTNSLMIDIIPGDGSVLEKFKLAHRGVDVLKALEEREKLDLENQRRDELIRLNKLGDPDIENVTVVSASDSLSDLLNLGGDDADD
jgi:hypothetical protein